LRGNGGGWFRSREIGVKDGDRGCSGAGMGNWLKGSNLPGYGVWQVVDGMGPRQRCRKGNAIASNLV